MRGRYNGLYGLAWSGGALLAPLGGTRLLDAGAPALWLACLVLCLGAAAAQLALGPAIRRREGAALAPRPASRHNDDTYSRLLGWWTWHSSGSLSRR